MDFILESVAIIFLYISHNVFNKVFVDCSAAEIFSFIFRLRLDSFLCTFLQSILSAMFLQSEKLNLAFMLSFS